MSVIKVVSSSGGNYTASNVTTDWPIFLVASSPLTEDHELHIGNEALTITSGFSLNTSINVNGFSVTIKASPGNSVNELWDSDTDPAKFGSGSVGARINFNNYGFTPFSINIDNFKLENLAISRDSSFDFAVFDLVSEKANVVIESCIFDITGFTSGSGWFQGPINIYNSFFACNDDSPILYNTIYRGNATINGCTILGPASISCSGSVYTLNIYNTVVVNTTGNLFSTTDGGTIIANTCATTHSTIGVVTDPSNILNIVGADTLQNVIYSNYDLRAKSTGPLANSGQNSLKTLTDFYGTTRDSTPYIGAHEAGVDSDIIFLRKHPIIISFGFGF